MDSNRFAFSPLQALSVPTQVIAPINALPLLNAMGNALTPKQTGIIVGVAG
jgi:hypothetical protein